RLPRADAARQRRDRHARRVGRCHMRRPDALMRTLAILVVAATSAAPTCAASAGPVWSIHRPGGGTVYLAGSVHVLDAARSRLPPAFDSAWRDAERVVMELDMDDLDPAAAASFLAAHATIGDGE